MNFISLFSSLGVFLSLIGTGLSVWSLLDARKDSIVEMDKMRNLKKRGPQKSLAKQSLECRIGFGILFLGSSLQIFVQFPFSETLLEILALFALSGVICEAIWAVVQYKKTLQLIENDKKKAAEPNY